MNPSYDLVVVGAGSGGIGAALAAARMGLSTLLLEAADTLGGNAVRGGVHNWEPGVGGTGIPFEIYRRLKAIPHAVGVTSIGRHVCWPASNTPPFPGGENRIDPSRRYRDTLRRHGSRGLAQDESFVRHHWHGVVFEPDDYVQVVRQMLDETGCCQVCTGRSFVDVEQTGGEIKSITLDDGRRVTARVWVDGTNSAALCRACGGVSQPQGPEPLNAVTLIYRITPADTRGVEPRPAQVPDSCWWAATFPPIACSSYPGGDRNVNMLPTMTGEACRSLGFAAARVECERRVRAHWHWMQSNDDEFKDYRLKWIAPALGVRETLHMDCDYNLSVEDVVGGLSHRAHADTVAIADHALDRHGPGGGCRELAEPYGIPLRCLLPRGSGNLMLASMAAGFSPVAATSCRLSRTIMQLGQAAGTAAALAIRRAVPLRKLDPAELRDALVRQHVQLDGPLTPELAAYLAQEETRPESTV